MLDANIPTLSALPARLLLRAFFASIGLPPVCLRGSDFPIPRMGAYCKGYWNG